MTSVILEVKKSSESNKFNKDYKKLIVFFIFRGSYVKAFSTLQYNVKPKKIKN